MSLVDDALATFAADIAEASAALGRRVDIDPAGVADRRPFLALKPPGVWSANRSCRMVRAADGWIAVNLPRESDRELVAAWLGRDVQSDDPWPAILGAARRRPWRELVAGGRLLGLPVAGVGEIEASTPEAPLLRLAPGGEPRPATGLRAIDLSALWAGPLCGAVLADAGMAVTKVESLSRPDVLRVAAPAMHHRLNGRKAQLALDFGAAADRARLGELMAGADVVITSARPRAFDQLGLSLKAVFARNPRLVWVAISGYGWRGEAADRVAFGDDAAAAGGLVRWTDGGSPRFLGDALADPLTGLAAALGALQAVARGGGFLVDAAMASTAAGAVSRAAARKAA